MALAMVVEGSSEQPGELVIQAPVVVIHQHQTGGRGSVGGGLPW